MSSYSIRTLLENGINPVYDGDAKIDITRPFFATFIQERINDGITGDALRDNVPQHYLRANGDAVFNPSGQSFKRPIRNAAADSGKLDGALGTGQETLWASEAREHGCESLPKTGDEVKAEAEFEAAKKAAKKAAKEAGKKLAKEDMPKRPALFSQEQKVRQYWDARMFGACDGNVTLTSHFKIPEGVSLGRYKSPLTLDYTKGVTSSALARTKGGSKDKEGDADSLEDGIQTDETTPEDTAVSGRKQGIQGRRWCVPYSIIQYFTQWIPPKKIKPGDVQADGSFKDYLEKNQAELKQWVDDVAILFESVETAAGTCQTTSKNWSIPTVILAQGSDKESRNDSPESTAKWWRRFKANEVLDEISGEPAFVMDAADMKPSFNTKDFRPGVRVFRSKWSASNDFVPVAHNEGEGQIPLIPEFG